MRLYIDENRTIGVHLSLLLVKYDTKVLCLRWKAKTQLVVGLLGYLLGALVYAGALGMSHFVADTP